MTELLLYALDAATLEPDLPMEAIAGRMKLFDLVTAQDDGWGWGERELTEPCFRLVSWPNLGGDVVDILMGPFVDHLTSQGQPPLNYPQPRGWFLNLLDPRIGQAMPHAIAWWRDATRQQPMFTMPANFPISPYDVLTARPAIPIIPA